MGRRVSLAGAWLGNVVGEGGTAAKDAEVADWSEVRVFRFGVKVRANIISTNGTLSL